MKQKLLFIGILILLIYASPLVFGQYSGSNPNVAESKAATANDSILGFGPSNAIDGDLNSYCAIPGNAPAWLQVDLGLYYHIDGYGLVISDPDELPLEYIFQGSRDGRTWLNVQQGSASSAGSFSYDLNYPDLYRYVRIYITGKDPVASIHELMIYGEEDLPPGPPLATAATKIDTSGFTANWQKLRTATGYTIDVLYADSSTTTYVDGYRNLDVGDVDSVEVTDLAPETSYAYRVRAYNFSGISPSSNSISVQLKISQEINFEELPPVIYGDSVLELNATSSSGLPISYESSDEEVATIEGSTVTLHKVGTTTLLAKQDGNEEYVPAQPVSQDLLVNPKELAVTGLIALDKVYDGGSDATLTGSTLEGVVMNDQVELTDDSIGIYAQPDVGTGIQITTNMSLGGLDANNYILVQPTGITGNITPAELVVVPDDMIREECTENPIFTISYTGFVGDDNASILEQEPVASTSADKASPAGSYEISVSGGEAANYLLVYETGTLLVELDETPPVLIVKNINLQLGSEGSSSIVPADVVSSIDDECGVADTTLSKNTFTSDDLGENQVEVIATDAAGNSTTEIAVVTVTETTAVIVGQNLMASIYPNPTDGKVHIELNTRADELKVMDMTGKIIFRSAAFGMNDVFDLSDYNAGIYIFQISLKEEILYIKVLKK